MTQPSPTPAILARLLDQSESEHLEFKTQVRDPRGAARILAALANSGGGHLVVGWNESARSVFPIDTREVSGLLHRAAALTKPSLGVTVNTLDRDGHRLIVATVASLEPGSLAVAPDGGVMRRDPTGRAIPVGVPETLKALSRADRVPPDANKLVQLTAAVGHLQQQLADLQNASEQHASVTAAIETQTTVMGIDLRAGFRAAAAERRLSRRMIEWCCGGLVGAAIALVLQLVLG